MRMCEPEIQAIPRAPNGEFLFRAIFRADLNWGRPLARDHVLVGSMIGIQTATGLKRGFAVAEGRAHVKRTGGNRGTVLRGEVFVIHGSDGSDTGFCTAYPSDRAIKMLPSVYPSPLLENPRAGGQFYTWREILQKYCHNDCVEASSLAIIDSAFNLVVTNDVTGFEDFSEY